jgi:glycosyltransferase involved in cell wall biosynthesis
MHIGFVIYGSLETVSGGYLYDRKLIDYFRRQGDQVDMLSLPWRSYASHLGDNLSSALFRRLSNLPVDILLQDELNHPSLFWLNRRLRTQVTYPTIAVIHHLRSAERRPSWQNWLYRQVECRYLSSLDGFIYNSQATRRVVETMAGTGHPGVVALPGKDLSHSTLPEEEIIRRASEPGPLRLVFLGNVIPRKGLHTLLRALNRLPRGKWRLSVIGDLIMDKKHVRSLQRLVKSAGLSNDVDFLGQLDQTALFSHLMESHVLVVPSYYEGFGIAYLEGMGFGLPSIAAQSGGAGELITHGENGYLIHAGDIQALADYLATWVDDRRLLINMSLAALERYRKHPTWEDTGARVRSFLR